METKKKPIVGRWIFGSPDSPLGSAVIFAAVKTDIGEFVFSREITHTGSGNRGAVEITDLAGSRDAVIARGKIKEHDIIEILKLDFTEVENYIGLNMSDFNQHNMIKEKVTHHVQKVLDKSIDAYIQAYSSGNDAYAGK